MVKVAISLVALVLSTTAMADQGSYQYAADTVDINQGVYICESASRATVDKLAAIPDTIERRETARRMGCPFHIGKEDEDYQPEEYPVDYIVASVCYKGGQDYCEEQAFAAVVYMQGKPKTLIGLWLDEDRD